MSPSEMNVAVVRFVISRFSEAVAVSITFSEKNAKVRGHLPRAYMTERRSQPRLLDCELVTICWPEDAENRNQLGKVNDVSLGGVGIRVDHPVPIGVPVTIYYNSLFDSPLNGVVRHRSEHPNGYSLGIEFIGDSNNASVHFHPELFASRANERAQTDRVTEGYDRSRVNNRTRTGSRLTRTQTKEGKEHDNYRA